MSRGQGKRWEENLSWWETIGIDSSPTSFYSHWIIFGCFIINTKKVPETLKVCVVE